VFERFTERSRRVLVLAQEEARLLGHGFIGTEHLLLGLVQEDEGIAARALASVGVSLEAARERVSAVAGPASLPPVGSPPFTASTKWVLEMSLREALQLGHNWIGTEHLLLGLLREEDGVGAQVLIDLGVELSSVRQRVLELVGVEGSGDPGVPTAEGHSAGGGPSGWVTIGPSGVGSRERGLPPRCPRCQAGLVDDARYRVIAVPQGERDPAEGFVSVTVVYCQRCGTAIGTA
jgi:ATP-dependent Clp protease ATP-binding subunit ClpC